MFRWQDIVVPLARAILLVILGALGGATIDEALCAGEVGEQVWEAAQYALS